MDFGGNLETVQTLIGHIAPDYLLKFTPCFVRYLSFTSHSPCSPFSFRDIQDSSGSLEPRIPSFNLEIEVQYPSSRPTPSRTSADPFTLRQPVHHPAIYACGLAVRWLSSLMSDLRSLTGTLRQYEYPLTVNADLAGITTR